MELGEMTALQLGQCIREGKVSVSEALETVLSQIDKREEELFCYITIDREGAARQAKELQERIRRGELAGPLAGVPFAIKDNLCTRGLRTTCGSKMLEHFVPAYDATAVERLRSAGALIIGKSNLDEFGMGSTTETSFFGQTKNPCDPTRVPGGSSGGSAAAVASGEAFAALGTDTGGSVRQPASHCGVVGFKPSYGTVSRYGLIAYASSMDQAGILARDVKDCAAIYGCITGRDEKDATSLDPAGQKNGSEGRAFGDRAAESISSGALKKLRIAVLEEGANGKADPAVEAAVSKAAKLFEKQGAEITIYRPDFMEYALPAYYTIACAEASSNLERYDGVKYGYRGDAKQLHDMYRKTRNEGFGEEVKKRILLGTFVLSSGYYDAYYLQALKVRRMIARKMHQAFEDFDLLLGPVAPTAAPRLGESLKDPMQMYLGDLYTIPASLAGLPAMSIPCGRDEKGLPIGVQLTAKRFGENLLFDAAAALEAALKQSYSDPNCI